MEGLNRKYSIISIIFLLVILLISFFIFTTTSEKAIYENIENQLFSTNKQNSELAKTKIEKMLKEKLYIFTENLIDSGSLDVSNKDNEALIKYIEYFRSENYIPITGVILDGEAIFINQNNERVYFDEKVIYDILSQDKNIFKYSNDSDEYIIVRNISEYNEGQKLVTVDMYNNGLEKDELYIPAYSDSSYSLIIDKEGNSIIHSSMNKSKFSTEYSIETVLSYSEENLDPVNKFRTHLYTEETGIIRYYKDEEMRVMSYSPIGVEDLYLCTVISEETINNTVSEFRRLNKISTIIILVDVFLLFSLFKFLEKNKEKERNKILDLDVVTGGKSYKKFQYELKKLYKKKFKVAYISLDIDNFKVVNTVLGREAGDEILKKIYEILEFHIDENGSYCRKAADQFLAYYKYKDKEDIEYVVNSIYKSIRHIKLPKNYILIPSIGIYRVNNDIPIENLEINAAVAKKKSKNKINEYYSYFRDDNLGEMIDNKKILDDMYKAILHREFRLVYQPKFDTKTKKVVGAEALIRWTKSDNTTVFPNEFIPIAEKTGFITFIDSYVFKEVCIKQDEWRKKGYNIVPISVNISREKIKDKNFLYEYLNEISRVGLEKKYVQLEITEGDTYSYDNVKNNIVDLIKEAGFTVLIDDFGVGYSSLTMLKDINADVLKLDKSFIDDDSLEGKAMIKNIINIAKIFNYKIVAEGVETEEQYNFLKEGCDEIQGYYFSKPLEEEEFIEKYLKNL